MCAPCYAATSASIAMRRTRTFAERVTIADEVQESPFTQWVGRIGRLSCFFAPRAGVSDLSMLFCRPTAPHLAPFILPSLGRRSGPRRSCAVLRQTANGQKTDQALRQQIPRRFVEVDMSNLWWPHMRYVLPD